jgi:hypothetical protein
MAIPTQALGLDVRKIKNQNRCQVSAFLEGINGKK